MTALLMSGIALPDNEHADDGLTGTIDKALLNCAIKAK
jgi:hypothetical protein